MNAVTRERAQSFLEDGHIERIVDAYRRFEDDPGFARAVGLDDIRANGGNLSLALYVRAKPNPPTPFPGREGGVRGDGSFSVREVGQKGEGYTLEAGGGEDGLR